MRDIYVFTESPMIYSECKQVLLANIKNVGTNQKDAFWSTAKVFWDMHIANETVFEDATGPEHIKELTEWASHIPIAEPFINYVNVHRSTDAKRIVNALVSIYPELFICVDDGTDWFGTAQEYLDAEFDY